jgi:phage tail-like protein
VDANGTLFHLLLTRDDWSRRHPLATGQGVPAPQPATGPGGPPPLRWHEAKGGFTLRNLQTDLPTPLGGAPLSPDRRRGAGADRYGSWYWIEGDGRSIRTRSAGAKEAVAFWPVARRQPEPPPDGAFVPAEEAPEPPAPPLAGLAVTAHHYLVAGALAPPGLLVFDLHGAGPPLVLAWPQACQPFDIAPVPEPSRPRTPVPADGGALVLDRERRQLWVLDRVLAVRGPAEAPRPLAAEDFHATPPTEFMVPSPPRPIELAAPPAAAGLDPVAVESLDGDLFLVLDRAEARVLVYAGASLVGWSALALPPELAPEAASRTYQPHDLVAVADAERPDDVRWKGRLLVASAEGNQSYAYVLEVREGAVTLTALPDHLPMRSFGGGALSGGPAGPAYDVPGAMVPLIEQPRPRFERAGALVTGVLVGTEPGCAWHRLFLDACIPPGCAVSVESRAGDDEARLGDLPFRLEPAPRLRPSGPEVPFAQQLAGAVGGTYELLFQEARGRFLQLRISFRGPGGASPRVRALRVSYPRFSWLQAYLPAVWRADPDSARFLDRFLANPEGMHTELEDRIAAAQLLFDPAATPPEALDWLASWVALALDPGWEERRKRLLLRHALDFYQWRGTARGLVMALRVALDPLPDDRIFLETDLLRGPVRIVEHFRMAQASAVSLGDPSELATSAAPRWTPALGVGRLLDGYRDALAEFDLAAPARFPAVAPAEAQVAQVWRSYVQGALGFVPTSGAAALRAWREFLARRYATLAALQAVHGAGVAALEELALPEALPEAGAALADWWEFQAVQERARLRAHQFTVVLPVALGDDVEDQRLVMALARRLVELEKPAHTRFDVRLYWAAFRVGEVRTGLDTVVGLGGRSPELMRPLVLGRGHLAESYLLHGPPLDARDRFVLGRDRIRKRKETP